ncbi:MAG: molybdate ABC transporter substrate-binding protein [Alphaproteobacteria bacterium]|nr:molybdate ABC transporter substrate-binding protein [Alphaproteobacteria bacterium]
MSLWSRVAGGLLAVAIALPVVRADAADVSVAVAANFTDAANEIGAAFQRATGHRAVYSFGSTGQLYTQITQGAPFQVFLSADQATAKRAVDENNAVAGTQFTYAVGKLVLYSKNPSLVTGEATLRGGAFRKIALANPSAAPYGSAAMEVMRALSVLSSLQPKIVQGDNIGQTYQFIDTGNAELGFVALSQVIAVRGGSRWIVPDTLYPPIRQDAVLTRAGANAAAARQFLDFLKSAEAVALMERYGYGKGT